MSSLDFLKPVISLLPEVAKPARAPALKEKLVWTVVALLVFFVMYHVFPVGVERISNPQSDLLQIVFASRLGSLLTVGIGPIVLASIFLQLFAGAKIIDIDLSNPEHKAVFSGTQKLLAILLGIFESAIYVYTNGVPVMGGLNSTLPPLFGDFLLTQVIVVAQLALASILLIFLDEIVSKYGIGSGISLFIAAGVSLAVIQGTVGLNGQGLFPHAIDAINQGGTDAIPNALIAFLPLAFTAAVFLASVYAEGMKVQIPLTFAKARGFGSGFPIKFLYVSNIPVILASALLLNLRLWSRLISDQNLNIGGVNVFHFLANGGWAAGGGIAPMDSSGLVGGGLLYLISFTFTTPLATGYGPYVSTLLTGSTPLPIPGLGMLSIPEPVHVAIYVAAYVVLCVLFGKFWVETTNMGPSAVAEQLQKSQLAIPGWRRDPRIIEGRLEYYIPTITVLGSAFVGMLAAFADLTGALGTGTGILLTVGILYKFYEQLSNEKLFELYPDLKKVVGR